MVLDILRQIDIDEDGSMPVADIWAWASTHDGGLVAALGGDEIYYALHSNK